MEALEYWFRENGGHLHPSIMLASDDLHGTHFRAEAAIRPGTHVLTVPHHLALSNLNALVDDDFVVFRTHARLFTVEALTFFYLMAQWVNKERSFWEPYLDTLPTPEEGFGTPLWFDEEDRKWLEGTDLHPTLLKREEIWQQYWRDGVKVLKSAGIDTTEYTWNLFKWAATVYTSRSFNSQTVRPRSSKYWTAYKHTQTGQQAVLLDIESFPGDWQEFSVLFPVMDAGNHNPLAKVDWAYDPGQFSLTVSEPIYPPDQIFNNYGPKGNEELLMGYGFCSPANPHDGALLTLRAPPQPLQDLLQRTHPHYFDPQTGLWDPKATTFRLLRSLLLPSASATATATAPSTPTTTIWTAIPNPLAELLSYMIRYERGLPIIIVSRAPSYDISSSTSQRHLPRIALYISGSLAPKAAHLTQTSAALPQIPRNPRQANAKIYRDAQLEVLRGVLDGLDSYQQSLRPTAPPCVSGGRTEYKGGIWTLEQVVDVLEVEAPEARGEFMAGLKFVVGTSRLRKIRGTPAEKVVWGILICFLYLYCVGLRTEGQGGGDEEEEEGMLEKWTRGLEVEYGRPVVKGLASSSFSSSSSSSSSAAATRVENEEEYEYERGEQDEDKEEGISEDEEAMAEVAPYLALIGSAADNLPGSLWTHSGWTADFMLDWGVRIAKSQGMHMNVGAQNSGDDDDYSSEEEGDVRYVVYLHVEEQDVEICEI